MFSTQYHLQHAANHLHNAIARIELEDAESSQVLVSELTDMKNRLKDLLGNRL